MTPDSNLKLTIAFTDPELDPEEHDAQAQQLISELKQMDEVEAVDRVLDPNPPEGNKALGGFLPGWLMAEVSVANGKKLLGTLSNRLVNKTVEVAIEGNGKKFTAKASSPTEIEALMKSASEFLNS